MGALDNKWCVPRAKGQSMRPIKSVIIDNSKKTGLELKTEFGLRAKLPYNSKYQIGESVEVTYNFYKKEVVSIISEEVENMKEPIEDDYLGVY